MFCKNCGKEIADGAKFCAFCGGKIANDDAPQDAFDAAPEQANAAQGDAGQGQPNAGQPNFAQPPYGQQPYGQQPYYGQPQVAPNDARSGGWAFLCFLFPLVGLILYLVWKDTMPLRSKSCGKGALIGVIVSFAVGFIGGIIMGLAEAAIYTQAAACLML